MSWKEVWQPAFASVLTSDGLQSARRVGAEWIRRIGKRPHRVTWYHRTDDPHSYLLAQVLPAFLKLYPVELICRTVGHPDAGAVPQPELAAGWAFRDATELATCYGLRRPLRAPKQTAIDAATARLQQLEADSETYVQQAAAMGDALWGGDPISGPVLDREHLARNNAELESRGHYFSGMLHYAGEWYWGLDRLGWLEQRLGELDLGNGATLVAGTPSQQGRDASELELFVSVRSPYSYIAVHRLIGLRSRLSVPIVVRPVLPMVMRGLPVPQAKKMYIVLDAAREARRQEIPFGRVCDPVGVGVERALAVFPLAKKQGLELEFLHSAMRAAWADGLDLATDVGLKVVVERVGLNWSDACDALKDESWRTEASKNREALFDLGLWGVPSFRLGDYTAWGQDRLWIIERKLGAADSS